MFVKLYRKYIPQKYRNKVYHLFLGKALWCCRNCSSLFLSKSVYLFRFLFPKNDFFNAYSFMGKYGLTQYPFQASLQYRDMEINVLRDEETNLPYVLYQKKKLYYPLSFSDEMVKANFRNLITEQDSESPHRYVRSYEELNGKTLLDIGAAEGIFTLEVIERIQKAYLFEYEEEWIVALEKTFKPWIEKVEIIKSFVGDKDNSRSITIDSFIKDKEQDHLFIKMDIEGEEQHALKGTENTLANNKNTAVSICTYHRKEDAEKIHEFLSSLGYTCEFTPGFFFCNKRMNKGVCRGTKKQS